MRDINTIERVHDLWVFRWWNWLTLWLIFRYLIFIIYACLKSVILNLISLYACQLVWKSNIFLILMLLRIWVLASLKGKTFVAWVCCWGTCLLRGLLRCFNRWILCWFIHSIIRCCINLLLQRILSGRMVNSLQLWCWWLCCIRFSFLFWEKRNTLALVDLSYETTQTARSIFLRIWCSLYFWVYLHLFIVIFSGNKIYIYFGNFIIKIWLRIKIHWMRLVLL